MSFNLLAIAIDVVSLSSSLFTKIADRSHSAGVAYTAEVRLNTYR